MKNNPLALVVQDQAELIAGMVEILRPDWVQSGFTGTPDAESLASFRQAGEIIGQAGARLAVSELRLCC